MPLVSHPDPVRSKTELSSWPAAGGTACGALTMQDITARWGAFYWIEYDGTYRATRPDGYVLPVADTPEGLDSAIRADWARWNSR